MNANEISSKANTRLKRIKIVSRTVKYILFVFLLVSFCFFVSDFFLWSKTPSVGNYDYAWTWYLSLIGHLVVCLWYWELARLFGFYERGLIFSSRTVQSMKFLALLCAIQWMLGTIYHILLSRFILQSHARPSVHDVTNNFRITFFSFGFSDVDFGLLLAGVIIFLVAWIMDEGRKIQEEQELTV